MPLQEKLLNSTGFRRQMHALTIESVRAMFPNIIVPEDYAVPAHDWPHLLLSASILAQYPSEKAQASALRIAHHCLSSVRDIANKGVAATLVLDILTNHPSIALAIKKKLVGDDFQKQVPLPLRLDMLRREVGHTIIRGKEKLHLNHFQKQVYEALEDFDCISISAPTSAGKSFILEQYMREFISSSELKNVVFIVPTRALIQQVESDLQSLLSSLEKKPLISSVPQVPQGWKSQTNVFVYTQERLQWLLNDAPADFGIDFLIVDEAQKIGDGARGILLQQAIETVIDRFPHCKVVFSSPMSRNPELLFQHVRRKGTPVASELVTVNQNLLWVSQTRQSQVCNVDLCFHGNRAPLGTIRLHQRPTDPTKRFTFIAQAMSDSSGGSLVYANGQADAEKMAGLLADSIPENRSDSAITDLMDLISKTIHPKYSLLMTLPRGVAFHYGNIPLLIRTEIERLFKEGKIRFLVCTSTLIEGVNLPARSIFVYKPTKGRGRPMDDIDFWNMAGRAGRLGKEFQGNIICVDPNKWDTLPPEKRTRYAITRTLDSVVSKVDNLLEFISTGKVKKEGPSKQELEHAFAYFFIQNGRHGSIRQAPFVPNCSEDVLRQLQLHLDGIQSSISLPLAVVVRNPGVSPLAQQSLLQYFSGYKKPITELIPTFPESEGAFDSYVRVLNRISKHLSGDFPKLNPYYAVLVINWMRGYPLARIISDNVRYWEKHPEKKKSIPAIIRDSMRDVEEFARFKFVKYSSCYVDVLRFFFKENGHQAYLDQIPDLNIWLEFGASQQTQISLMGLGLSRQTAISVSELIPSPDFGRKEVIAWIKGRDLEGLDLSPIILAELKRVAAVL
ncbi:MAG: DEAD/DEAH box helicase [Candidatus Omnitrophota bacterium]